MVYSQAKVIAGGLAHIPIVISVFYFIMISFNKRALEFAETNKLIKPKSKVVESKTETKPLMAVKAETEEVKETEVKEEKAQAIKEISNKLEEIEKKAEDVKEKVKKKQKDKKKKKKKKDMKRD
ncbi:hypothetical protein OA189_01120 [Prochlorococcus sp. AH-716-P20]|nr:hypothetical protein [Prochlorococcus sp. AH-716-P20]